jgi:hypothetical protein
MISHYFQSDLLRSRGLFFGENMAKQNDQDKGIQDALKIFAAALRMFKLSDTSQVSTDELATIQKTIKEKIQNSELVRNSIKQQWGFFEEPKILSIAQGIMLSVAQLAVRLAAEADNPIAASVRADIGEHFVAMIKHCHAMRLEADFSPTATAIIGKLRKQHEASQGASPQNGRPTPTTPNPGKRSGKPRRDVN